MYLLGKTAVLVASLSTLLSGLLGSLLVTACARLADSDHKHNEEGIPKP